MPTLSPTHLAAIARRRRLIVNFDVTFAINVQHRRNPDRPDLVEHLFEFADAPGSQIDSMWWNWGEGNQAPYPSQHLPLYDHPLYQQVGGRRDGYRRPSPRGHPAPRPRVLFFASHERLGQRPRPVCAHPRKSRASRLALSHALVYARGQRLLEFRLTPSTRLCPAQLARSDRALAF